MTDAVYLDHNASSPVRPESATAVCDALSVGGNASSVHRHGRLAKRVLEDAREKVASLAGVKSSQVVFTSGGSEANTMAVSGFGRAATFASEIEHVSVLNAIEHGSVLPVDEEGRVDPDVVQEFIDKAETDVLVSVMYANNETGVFQPVREIAELVHARGGLFHCDAIQAAGKTRFDFEDTGADLMTLSAHKIGGPQGVGALIVREGLDPRPLIRGGGQEFRWRAGTENLPGISGFGAAAEAAQRDLKAFQRLAELRDRLEQKVLDLAPVTIFGADAPRLPNTSCLTMPGVGSETQIMGLDLAGIAVSAGSACSSGKVEPSHVLRAMGVSEDLAGTAIRISFGWNSNVSDVDRFVDAWGALYSRAGNTTSSSMKTA